MLISKRGQVRSLIMKGFFALFLLSLPVCKSEAAVLAHSHDDSCYSDDSFICTNHEIQYEYIEEYGYCPYCEASRWMKSGIRFFDVCLDNYIARIDVACERTCEVCGNTSRYGRAETSQHEVTRRVQACGFSDNEGLFELSLLKDSSDWTNQDVTLTASVTVLNAKASLPGDCLDWGNGYSSLDTQVVSKNGTYFVTLKDTKGGTVSESITVSNIDKTPPKLSLEKSTEAWSENGIDICITATDDESGLSDAPYCFMEHKSNSNSFHVDKNGDYTISVQDRAGNLSIETISIRNIGKDPAIVAREQEEWRLETERLEKERLEKERLQTEESIKKEEARRAAEEHAKEEAKLATKKAEAEKEKAKAKQMEEERKILEAKMAEEERLNREAETASAENLPEEPGMLIPVIEIVPLTGTKMGNERIIEEDRETELIIEEPDTAQAEIVFEDISDEIYSIEGEFFSERREDEENRALIWKILLGAGVVLTAIGLFVISKFSYIYMTDHGRKRIISPVKIVPENNKVEVLVDDKKLKPGTRYLIHYSPWVYRQLRGKEVFVICEYTSKIINADEGYVFLYT